VDTTRHGSPAELEALLRAVCSELAVPPRRYDEIRMLVTSDPGSWPVCCKGSCSPCIDESTSVARLILARWAARAAARS
jgi:hypothetical protein